MTYEEFKNTVNANTQLLKVADKIENTRMYEEAIYMIEKLFAKFPQYAKKFNETK